MPGSPAACARLGCAKGDGGNRHAPGTAVPGPAEALEVQVLPGFHGPVAPALLAWPDQVMRCHGVRRATT